jgi:hypothetical protein
MKKQVLQTNAFKNQIIFLKDKKDVNDFDACVTKADSDANGVWYVNYLLLL